MKTNLKLFFCFALLLNSNLIIAQSFRYNIFELNKVVTFNDVVNYIEDKSKIITEPSVYTKGEDIKFKDFFNTTTTFKFYENTQILKCIIIDGISNTYYLEQLKTTIFQQLGNPIHGYEIKITNDVKDNSVMSDYMTYEYKYKYKNGDKYLDFWIHSFSLQMIDNKSIPVFSFSVWSDDLKNDSDLNINYPSLHSKDFDWLLQRYELINKW